MKTITLKQTKTDQDKKNQICLALEIQHQNFRGSQN